MSLNFSALAFLVALTASTFSFAGVQQAPYPSPVPGQDNVVVPGLGSGVRVGAGIGSPSYYNPGNSLLGRWRALNVLQGDGVQFRLYFNFAPNHASLTVHCSFFDGARLRATATSPVYYGNHQVFIQQPSRNTSQDGVRFCQSTIQVSRWDAYMNGYGRMNLVIPVPYQNLTLVKE